MPDRLQDSRSNKMTNVTRRGFLGMMGMLPLPPVVGMTAPKRPFHIVDITEFPACQETHVETTGMVAYVSKEDDGDLHIKLVPHWSVYEDNSGEPYVMCEAIPELPIVWPRRPKVGDTVRVRGIRRYDDAPGHGWWEVHPIVSAKLLVSVSPL